MKKNILKCLAICVALFMIINSFSYIAFNFDCVDALVKLLGFKEGIRELPMWLKIVVIIGACIIIRKFDAIFDYAFENKDRRKYK